MDRTHPLFPAYRRVLARHAMATHEMAREEALLDAGELAKLALADGQALDEMVAMHQTAQAALANDWRDSSAGTVIHAARERLARGESTPMLLALMLPHDLAQRAHHERRWQREHSALNAMFEQTDQLIVVLDAEGLIEDVNPAFVRATGWSPKEAALSSEQVWSLVLGDGQSSAGPHRSVQLRRDGSNFTAEWSVSPIMGHEGRLICRVCIGRDVTRAQQVEAGLRENDKLRAVATLAGGIAHDFNNLLGSIMGLAELCALDAPPGARLTLNLANIGVASRKAAALVRQLLDFSRRTPVNLQPVQAGDWLRELLPLLCAAVQGRATVSMRVSEDGVVRLDTVQMEQVLLNLVRNAADAIGTQGGAVHVVADCAESPDVDTEPEKPASGGPLLRLRVIDNGCGIDPAVLDKIFDPFFTTKRVGEGTGLGLAAVHGIVVGHGGRVAVTSTPGAGATFSVYLPLVIAAAPTAQLNVAATESQTEALRVNAPHHSNRYQPKVISMKTILVVDDSSTMVMSLKSSLEIAGFKVETASDGQMALDKLKGGLRPDLMITDINMPRMDGLELIAHARKLLRFTPILALTTESQQGKRDEAKKLGATGWLLKPVGGADLVKVIKQVLPGA